MARDNCDTGRKRYKTKGEAERANPGQKAKRCDRCFWWHADADRPRSRRR